MNDAVLTGNTAYVVDHKDRYRAVQQRTTGFVSFGSNTIRLTGWSAESFAELVAAGSRKPLEIIETDFFAKAERQEGDIVSKTTFS